MYSGTLLWWIFYLLVMLLNVWTLHMVVFQLAGI